MLYLLRKREQTQTTSNILDFIAVVPVAECKEVHGLANVMI